jgi:hypothetical protein
VRFKLDSGSEVSRSSPFDFAGTGRNGRANPLNTTGLGDGPHTLTATVTRSNGSVLATLAATFTVANAPAPPPPPPPPPTGGYWTPAPGTTWQWQLTGTLDTTVPAAVYDVDGFATTADQVAVLHAQGRKVICYLSVGSWEEWRPDAASFPASVKGKSNGWPGEKWLDIRRIDILGPIMTARFQMCRDKGFDAIEPDNIDGYTNSSGFPLTASDQATYNRWIADTAHSLGLSVGLKNDVDQIAALQPSFDWALNEQCYQYAECGGYASFVAAGKAVFIAEYQGSLSTICPKARAAGFSVIKKRLELDAWREAC